MNGSAAAMTLPIISTMTERYPSTETIREIAGHCRILTVHEEVWRDAPDWVDDPPGGNYRHPKPWEIDRHVPFDETELVRFDREYYGGLAKLSNG